MEPLRLYAKQAVDIVRIDDAPAATGQHEQDLPCLLPPPEQQGEQEQERQQAEQKLPARIEPAEQTEPPASRCASNRVAVPVPKWIVGTLTAARIRAE